MQLYMLKMKLLSVCFTLFSKQKVTITYLEKEIQTGRFRFLQYETSFKKLILGSIKSINRMKQYRPTRNMYLIS